MRLVLTAGFDRALHVVAMAELLSREGRKIVGFLVVTPWSWKRGRSLLRQRGWHGLLATGRKLLGVAARRDCEADPLACFLRERDIPCRSIKTWAARAGVPCHVVPAINSRQAAEVMRSSAADGLIYGGGGILHDEILAATRGRVLNAHSGPMPEIRGMNACEWSLLLGVSPAVTIHFIDRGVDTGPILERIPVPVERGDTIARLRSKCTVLGIKGICRNVGVLGEPPPLAKRGSIQHRQCYILAPALRELLELRLAAGIGMAESA